MGFLMNVDRDQRSRERSECSVGSTQAFARWPGKTLGLESSKRPSVPDFEAFFLRRSRNTNTLQEMDPIAVLGIGRPNCLGSADFCG
jgi:hypothetical protein